MTLWRWHSLDWMPLTQICIAVKYRSSTHHRTCGLLAMAHSFMSSVRRPHCHVYPQSWNFECTSLFQSYVSCSAFTDSSSCPVQETQRQSQHQGEEEGDDDNMAPVSVPVVVLVIAIICVLIIIIYFQVRTLFIYFVFIGNLISIYF